MLFTTCAWVVYEYTTSYPYNIIEVSETLASIASQSLTDSIYVGGEYLRSLLVSPTKLREVTGSYPDYLPPRPEVCVQLLKVKKKTNMSSFVTKISCCYDIDWTLYLWSWYTRSALQRISFDVRRWATGLRWTPVFHTLLISIIL